MNGRSAGSGRTSARGAPGAQQADLPFTYRDFGGAIAGYSAIRRAPITELGRRGGARSERTGRPAPLKRDQWRTDETNNRSRPSPWPPGRDRAVERGQPHGPVPTVERGRHRRRPYNLGIRLRNLRDRSRYMSWIRSFSEAADRVLSSWRAPFFST